MALPLGPGPGPLIEDERERDRLEGKAHQRDRDRDRGRARPHPSFPVAPPPPPQTREPRLRTTISGVPPPSGSRLPTDLDHDRENYERVRTREREKERERDREREQRDKEPRQREGMGYIHQVIPAPVPRKPDDGTSPHVSYPYAQVSAPPHSDADVHHPHPPPSYEHAHNNPYPHPHPHQHPHNHHPTHLADIRAPPAPSSAVGSHPHSHSHGHTHSRPHTHAHQHPHQHQHQHQHPPHLHGRSHFPATNAHHSHTPAAPPTSRVRMVPPVHLGAFVHPFGPLPLPRNRAVARATLYIPALALPRARPAHPRVWGSGPYTDDSDIISAAVHAGRVRWSEVRDARRRGRDARVEVQVVPAAERYIGNVGSAVESGGGGDPEDDGRGFFSAGWGNGHEGAGIEILDVAFVKGGTAHRAPGLGRQNRKQRLGEYATERGAVLGFAASAAASGAAGGRTKRARGVGVGNTNAPDSDETDEDGIETESEIEEDDDEDMDVDALAARVTIVFEGGRGGALPGFKYDPGALREAVLRPRLLRPNVSVPSNGRKRQRIDDDTMDDTMDSAAEKTGNGYGVPVPRGVELETAVELFLLRMYNADCETDSAANDEEKGDGENTEMATEDTQNPQGGREGTRMQNDRRRWEIWLLGTIEEASLYTKKVEGDSSKREGAVLLQRGLRASNLEFVEGEMRVLQDPPSAESGSCTREGWAIEVRRWRWAR
ncbi:hypothetical protein EI94DRAFT_1722135 [Lactarius quietus]|nr:hypothetical protein EI94DRAFT_1722135 [Lactarius quietus]